jgi:hypothetical protein
MITEVSTTSSNLVALYTERAQLAFQAEHGVPTERHGVLQRYIACAADIHTQEQAEGGNLWKGFCKE